jgi:hypothetical protein
VNAPRPPRRKIGHRPSPSVTPRCHVSIFPDRSTEPAAGLDRGLHPDRQLHGDVRTDWAGTHLDLVDLWYPGIRRRLGIEPLATCLRSHGTDHALSGGPAAVAVLSAVRHTRFLRLPGIPLALTGATAIAAFVFWVLVVLIDDQTTDDLLGRVDDTRYQAKRGAITALASAPARADPTLQPEPTES